VKGNQHGPPQRNTSSFPYLRAASVTAQSCTNNSRLVVESLYNQIPKRDPDPPGLRFWESELNGGRRSVKEVVRGIAQSKEFNARFIRVLDVTSLYRQLLRRDPDLPGLNFWAEALASGKTIRQTVREIASSQEFGLPNIEDDFSTELA